MLRLIFNIFTLLFLTFLFNFGHFQYPSCELLFSFQISCENMTYDNSTFEISNCTKNFNVPIQCSVLEGVQCVGNRSFIKYIPCYYTFEYIEQFFPSSLIPFIFN